MSDDRFGRLFEYAKQWGLSDRAARGYATLAYWTELVGIAAPAITSGRRSPQQQQKLIADSIRGVPGIYTPATASKHLTGDAFDVSTRFPGLAYWHAWARYAGLRSGSNFSKPDPVHFDTG